MEKSVFVTRSKVNDTYTTHTAHCIFSRKSPNFSPRNPPPIFHRPVYARTPIAPGTVVQHQLYGIGVVKRFDRHSGVMTVSFASKDARFLYPHALTKRFLTLVQPKI